MRYLRVYEWFGKEHGRHSPGVCKAVVLDMFHDEPGWQIEWAVNELAKRRPGERVLLPFWLLSKEIRPSIPEIEGRKDLDWLPIFENGVDVGPSIKWLWPLAERLRERGIALDLVIADVEDAVTTWAIMGPWDADEWERRFRRIYDSPAAYARFPEELKRLKPSDYNPWTEPGRRAMNEFNRYAASLTVEAIRKVFIDSKLFHDARGRQPFRISNWWDNRPSFPLVDPNGWPIAPLAVDSVSAPPAYLIETGALYRGREHERLWCAFVHAINNVRSCLGTKGGSVIPWISSPRYYRRHPNGDENSADEGYDGENVWLWRELIAHLVRAGCREFHFWNADTDTGEAHRLLVETMRMHDKPFLRRPLPELPLDVDEVTTRGHTTRYSDFLAVRSRNTKSEGD